MRQVFLTVEGEAPLRDGNWYKVGVVTAEVLKRKKWVEVTLRHGKGEHEGRCHVVQLALPIRPNGITAEFFRACGFEVSEGTTVRPSEVVGRTLEVKFQIDLTGMAVVSSFRGFDQEKPR